MEPTGCITSTPRLACIPTDTGAVEVRPSSRVRSEATLGGRRARWWLANGCRKPKISAPFLNSTHVSTQIFHPPLPSVHHQSDWGPGLRPGDSLSVVVVIASYYSAAFILFWHTHTHHASWSSSRPGHTSIETGSIHTSHNTPIYESRHHHDRGCRQEPTSSYSRRGIECCTIGCISRIFVSLIACLNCFVSLARTLATRALQS